jgi:glucan 1,3-beta-glucosidase
MAADFDSPAAALPLSSTGALVQSAYLATPAQPEESLSCHPPLRPFSMIRPFLLFAFVSTGIALAWFGLGRPVPMPASPLGNAEKLHCVSYAPFRGRQAPFDRPIAIAEQQIAEDLQRLSLITGCVRTYSASEGQGMVTPIAARYGLKVMQGIWLGRDLSQNRREIVAALDLARQYPDVIQSLIVGNEVLLRGELSSAALKDIILDVRASSPVPVTYADVWEFWLKASELVPAVDFVTIHILPYWEDKPVAAADAGAHVGAIRRKLAEVFGAKEILIGEVGWPSAGRMREGALPSPANQALVLHEVLAAAKHAGWKVNVIEAFDQPWKRLLEGTVGGYWGLFDGDTRQAKFRWGEPVSDHPRWPLNAGLGIAAALATFLCAWLGTRDRRSHPELPRMWLAVSAVALASGLFFGRAALSLSGEYIEGGAFVQAAVMVALAALVPPLAAVAIVRKVSLDGPAAALNWPYWRNIGLLGWLLALLFAATLVAALQVALGLVFDPRYKDFPLAALTGPAIAFAAVSLANGRGIRSRGAAELLLAALLAASALFIVLNEKATNWQALWLAAILGALGATALRARGARS